MKIRYNITTIMILTIVPILFLAVMLQGCSGSRSKDEVATSASAPPLPPPATTLNGIVSKGPVSGATVNVFAVRSGLVDRSVAIGTGQTVDGGSFSIDLGSHDGPVLVEVTEGTFTDEASGVTVALKVPLHAVVSDTKANATTTVAVTPMTELAFKKAKGAGPLTAGSIDDANASIARSFGLTDIISILPVPGGETDGQKKYAAACGAFSKLINDNKNDGESLDDALERILGRMGEEEENGGVLSTESTGMINNVLPGESSGASNTSGSTEPAGTNPDGTAIVSLPTFTMGLLHLATVGIPFAMTSIDVTIALPLGVTVDYDRITGETPPGIVMIAGVADFGNNNVVVAKFTPAFFGTPALLHIVVINSNGFGLGEFADIQFNVIPGGLFPPAVAFIPVNFFAKGLNGVGLIGVAAVPLFVEGI
jgi:hypothetical protein